MKEELELIVPTKRDIKALKNLTKATKSLRKTLNKVYQKTKFDIVEEVKRPKDLASIIDPIRNKIMRDPVFQRWIVEDFRRKEFHKKQYYKMKHKRFKRKG